MANAIPDVYDSPQIETIWASLDVVGEKPKVSTSTPNLPTSGTRPPRRKSRRSWFDKTPTKYEIAVEENRRSKSRKSEVEEEMLMLTHFTNPPKISFGTVKPGVQKTRTLIIRNPHDYEQSVKVEKFPHKKKFSVENLDFTVGPKGTFLFEISWTPEEEGRVREMILFVVDNSYRLQGFVFGSVEAPPKKKLTRRKGLLGSKVQRPFSVLHTQSLANIKKSYSPKKDEKRKSDEKIKPLVEVENEPQGEIIIPEQIDLDVDKENCINGKSKNRKKSNMYVKMLNIEMSPIGMPPGIGKGTETNDILHSTVRSDIDMHASPQDSDHSKQNFVSPAPKTPEKQNIFVAPQETKAFISPNSFLQDSLCMHNDSFNELKTKGDLKDQVESTTSNDKRGQKMFLSPETFLKDLNTTLDNDKKESPQIDIIPSPDTVLKGSIPHEIMVKQLDSVKTKLQKNKSSTTAMKAKTSRQCAETKEPSTNSIRRETYTKTSTTVASRRQSSIGSRDLSNNACCRETFVTINNKANPFVKVPETCSSSPRRTTFTVKQKPASKPRKENFVKASTEKRQYLKPSDHKIEKDVTQKETIIYNKIETVSTTKYTEVIDRYTCTVEKDIPTPERSLVINQQYTTKSETSKMVDSSTVTKNKPLPTPERSLCGKQLFSPQTGQTFHNGNLSGDNLFGSPRRMPDSPLAAVVSTRVSLTVTKERPSDALLEQSERKLSTCLFGKDDDEDENLEEDSLEEKRVVNKRISTIEEETDSCFTPLVNKTSNHVWCNELDTPMREAGYSEFIFPFKSDRFILDKHTSDDLALKSEIEPSTVKQNSSPVHTEQAIKVFSHQQDQRPVTVEVDTPVRIAQGESIICEIDTPLRSLKTLNSKTTKECQAVPDNNEERCSNLESIDCIKTVVDNKETLDENFGNLESKHNLLKDTKKEMIVSITSDDENGKNFAYHENHNKTEHYNDTPMRNLTEQDQSINLNTKSKRRSFWEKPCDLSITFENLDTPLRELNGMEKSDCEEKIEQRRSFWEKHDEAKTSPLIMKRINIAGNISGDEEVHDHVSGKEGKDNAEKNNSFPTTPYHLLPKVPNPDNSRRSTHVVEKPKVLNLDDTQKKKLFQDQDDVSLNKSHDVEVIQAPLKIADKLEVETEVVDITSELIVKEENRSDNVYEAQNTFCTKFKEKTVDVEEVKQSDDDFTKLQEKEKVQEDVKDDQTSNEVFFVSLPSTKPVDKPIRNGITKTSRNQPIKPAVKVGKKNVSPKRPLTNAKTSENKRRKTNEDIPQKSSVKKEPTELKSKTKENEQIVRKSVVSRGKQMTTQLLNKESTATLAKTKAPTKGVPQSKLLLIKKTKTALPKHPLPFAAKNMYYDERWMQKQERGFVHWLNFVLTPPDEYQQTKKVKVDAGSLCFDSNRNNVKLAPTREVLSFRAYSQYRRLNQLRRAACKLFQTKEVVHVVQKVEVEVESGRLFVRKDRKVHADLGLKQAILDMLLSFNPLWLRIGLETTFGEMIMLQTNGDVIGLSRFIITRLLGNPDIASEYCHPSVPHLYRDGYAEAIARHLLKKFLILVYFLDHAKTNRLVPQDPCLFCKDADYKTCKTLLIEFSRDYLAGEGDITRHLGYLGYQIKHTQTTMDEFDYAVTNLAMDLKDGIRLARVMEILSEDSSLTKRLRAPAISRLQKVHNMDVVFQTLSKHGITVDQNGSKVISRDIVDGHREKTLKLLWALIVQYQVNLLLNKEQLKEEIRILERSLRVKKQLAALQRYEKILKENKRESIDPELFSHNDVIHLLLKWSRVVCAFYGIKVENFTVSFGDGRVLCHLIHHYHPSLLPREIIRSQTMMTFTDDMNQSHDGSMSGSFSQAPFNAVPEDNQLFEELLANEKENFKILYEKVSGLGGIPLMLRSADMSNTIPDEKVVVTYVTYLCARLLDIRHESRAARVIQLAWRRYHLRKIQKNYELKQKSVVVIQRAIRTFLKKRKWQRETNAARIIQTLWRGYRSRKLLSQLKWKRDNEKKIEAAKVIKRCLIAFGDRRCYMRKLKAIQIIQVAVKRHQQRQKYLRILTAVRYIQMNFRAFRRKMKCRSEYLEKKKSTIKIQSLVRMWIAKKLLEKERAALTIQKNWRMNFCHKKYKKSLSSAVIIQAWWRMAICKRKYQRIKNSVLTLQKYTKAFLLTKADKYHYQEKRNSCIKIQQWWRAMMKKEKAKKETAAVKIQTAFKGYKVRREYTQARSRISKLQATFRMWLEVRNYRKQRKAALRIQKWYRGHLAVVKCRTQFRRKKNAVIYLQASVRKWRCMKEYTKIKKATVLMQSQVRTVLARRDFQRRRNAICLIQKYYRTRLEMLKVKNAYSKVRTSCVKIQSYWRGWKVRQKITNMHKAAIIIQTQFRYQIARDYFLALKELTVVCQKQWRAKLKARKERVESMKMRKAAILIQSAFRGHLCKQEYKRIICGVVKIQSAIRGCQHRRQFVKLKNAVMVIQSKYRAMEEGRLLRTQYLVKKGAAITIQAFIRGFRVRQMLRNLDSAADVIQSSYRAYSQRKKFLLLKEKVLICQRFYHAKVQGQNDRAEYLKKRRAVVTLQSYVRRIIVQREIKKQTEAARKIQAIYKGYLQMKKFKQLKEVVQECQSLLRAKLIGQNIRREFLLKKLAALTIQRYFRHYKIRRTLKLANDAATKIQAFYKGHKKRIQYLNIKQAVLMCQKIRKTYNLGLKVRKEFLMKKKAAITLQAGFKGWMVRKEVREKHEAARKIQSFYNGYVKRKEYKCLKSATVRCQNIYRAHRLGSNTRKQFLVQKGAAITIQAGFRGWKIRQEIACQNKAASIIKSAYKGYVQRGNFTQLKCAVILCQKIYRKCVIGVQTRKEYLKRKDAIIRLQSVIRGWKVRIEMKKCHQSAVTVQSVYRGFVESRKYRRLKKSVVKCQERFRAKQLGTKIRREFLIQKGAALTIEDWYCDCLEKRKQQQRIKAATILQSYFRGRKCRQIYWKLRAAACIIQKHFRNFQLMKQIRTEYLTKQASVVTIQRFCRGHLVRKTYLYSMKQIIKIQCAIKSYLCRQRFVELRSAVKVCQMRYRAKLKGREEKQAFLKSRSTAIMLQSQIRRWNVQRRYKKILSSAVTLQKNVRMYLARKQFRTVKSAVKVIQEKWRALMLMRKTQREYLILKGAAITIQACWKGHRAQIWYTKTYHLIIKLQSLVQSKQSRKKYLTMRSSAIIIQSHFRAYMAGKETRQRYIQMKQSAIKIQSLIRGNFARVQFKREKACVVIQSHYKGYDCRKNYNKIRSSVIKMQAGYRGMITRHQYQQKMNAVVKIQKCVKKKLFRKRVMQYLEMQQKSAVRIQAWFRGCQIRRVVKKFKAALTLQAVFRMMLERRRFTRYRRNLIIVQSYVRRYLALKKAEALKKEHSAATCIQRAYRNFKERQLLEARKRSQEAHLKRFARVTWINLAAMSIQRFYRKHKMMLQAKEKLSKIIIIQRWMRAKLCRLRYLKFQRTLVLLQQQVRCHLQMRDNAAVTIQRVVRKWLLLRRQKLKIKAIVRIQAIWRGEQVRRRSVCKKIELIRKRVEEANRSAREENTLGYRMASALDYLLRYKQLSHILEVLIHLDVATRLSPSCCEKFVSCNAVQVIYRLVRGCNRSQPHMELIRYSVSILLNLAKYEKTVYEVYNVEDAADTLIELMQIYREKGVIFNSTCMLLGILGMLDRCRMEVREDKKLSEKIRSIHLLTTRKHKIDETRQLRQARLLAAKSFNCSLPIHIPHKKTHKIKPDWVLRKDKMKEIQDPLAAINFVMDSFQLKPK